MAVWQHRIGIIVENDPFAACQLVEGVSDYAAEQKNWVIKTVGNNTSFTNSTVKYEKCNGVAFHNGQHRVMGRLHKRGLCVVNIEPAEQPMDPPITCVEPDNFRVGEIGANHLIGLGFPRLAFLSFSRGKWSEDRRRGFTCKVQAAGLPCTQLTAPQDATWWDAMYGELIPRLLEKLQRPVAVMAANDILARRAIEVCTERGWLVPEEVAVLGVDNDRMSSQARPILLSSIDLNRRGLGYAAAQWLDCLLDGKPHALEPIKIEPRGVIVRQSTAKLAFDDADLRAAVRYIREKALEGISVADVARHVNISRSTLERRFEQELHRPPGDEIRHVRLERAERLVRQTNRSMLDIAHDTGFSSLPYLCHAFKRHFGCTPSTYRQRMARGRINSD